MRFKTEFACKFRKRMKMTDDIRKILEGDADGMATYEYIVNNCDTCDDCMDGLTENLIRVDRSGQFLASSARFLTAVDRERFSKWLPVLIEGAIAKDRERRYIGALLEAIWGEGYESRIEELSKTDDNFRRIYKRIHPETASDTRHNI